MGAAMKQQGRGELPPETVEIQGYTFASNLMVGRLNQHGKPWTRRTICQYNVEQVLHANNRRHSKRDKNISEKTKAGRWIEVKAAFHDLHDLGYKILYPTSMETKHFVALCRYWEEQDFKPSTILQKVSKLSVFLSWVNKSDMVRKVTLEQRYKNPERFKRQTATTTDKSWNDEIDFDAIFERVSKEDKHVAKQLKLSLLFGMRAKESMRIKPFYDYDKVAQVINIHRGTKGGHKRTVPVETQEQRDFLDQLLDEIADKKGSMMPRLATQDRWMKHYYYTLSKCGLSKKDNTNSHALRHRYAQQRYEEKSGIPSPVKQSEHGIKVEPNNTIAERIARLLVSQELGHQRESITSAYIG